MATAPTQKTIPQTQAFFEQQAATAQKLGLSNVALDLSKVATGFGVLHEFELAGGKLVKSAPTFLAEAGIAAEWIGGETSFGFLGGSAAAVLGFTEFLLLLYGVLLVVEENQRNAAFKQQVEAEVVKLATDGKLPVRNWSKGVYSKLGPVTAKPISAGVNWPAGHDVSNPPKNTMKTVFIPWDQTVTIDYTVYANSSFAVGDNALILFGAEQAVKSGLSPHKWQGRFEGVFQALSSGTSGNRSISIANRKKRVAVEAGVYVLLAAASSHNSYARATLSFETYESASLDNYMRQLVVDAEPRPTWIPSGPPGGVGVPPAGGSAAPGGMSGWLMAGIAAALVAGGAFVLDEDLREGGTKHVKAKR